jgi:phosphate starvation-inducible protein PhoH
MSQKTLATPARTPLRAKAPRITRFDRTPMMRAASKSSADARSAMPNNVLRKSHVVAARVARVITIVARSATSKVTPPRVTVSKIHPGLGMLSGLGDTYMTKKAATTKCTPNDVRSIVNSSAPRTHRKARNSIATAVRTEVAITATARRPHPAPRDASAYEA